MIGERVLLDDGAITLAEARCVDAPIAPGTEEVVRTTEVIIPLGGIYVRAVRRAGSPAAVRTTVGDPGRALVFRRDEPYRISHPAGGNDRSLAVTLTDLAAAHGIDAVDDLPIPIEVALEARRLARGLHAGVVDALAGAERAMSLVAAIARQRPVGGSRIRPGDRRIAGAVRLEIAGRLGERLTLPQLGRAFGLSGWELARRFRRGTGTSIHVYRTRLRVQAALERVEAGEQDLTALALDLGFADHSHMTNVVRRTTGAPPSAFRSSRAWMTATEERTILQA